MDDTLYMHNWLGPNVNGEHSTKNIWQRVVSANSLA